MQKGYFVMRCEIPRRPQNITRERIPFAGQDGFKWLWSFADGDRKFEVLLIDLLCTHEPVTLGKILIIIISMVRPLVTILQKEIIINISKTDKRKPYRPSPQ